MAEQLRLAWSNYRVMSPFVHGNTFEVAQSFQNAEQRVGEPERFGLSYEDDVKRVETVLPFLQFLLFVYLRFVREVLIGTAEVPDPAQLSEADEALGWARFVLASLPKDYWRQVVADVDYLFEVLETADAGGDWKALRDQRPEVPRRGAPQ